MSKSLIDAIGRGKASKLMRDAVARAIEGNQLQGLELALGDKLDAAARSEQHDQIAQDPVQPLNKCVPIA